MAVTVAGRELTEQHRLMQLAVRAGAAREVARLWAAFDLADIDGSWLAIAPGMEAVVREFARQSAGVAGGYYQAFRTAEGAPGTPTVRMAAQPPSDVLRYSLGFYGQIVPKQLIQRGTSNVAATTLTHVVGGATRHVLNGGRYTLIDSVRSDRQAVGYARVTAAQPCAFCAMLASRGIVFKSGSFAGSDPRFTGAGTEKVHDHCACTVEPAYSRDAALPGRGDEFAEMYTEHAQGQSDPLNAFRRAYERPQLHVA